VKLSDEQLALIASDEPMLAKALALAERGYHVFPLRPNGKTPLTTHGFKDASRDELAIRRWWNQRPTANIGIACGASGILVADLDVKHGGTGPEQWSALVKDADQEPGVQALTPTGGQHLIWRATGVRSSNGQVAKHVDIKADGGYIVAPGSVIDGNEYRTSDGRPLPRIADLPPASEALKVVATSRKRAESRADRPARTGTTAPLGNWSGTVHWTGSSDYETHAVSAEIDRLHELSRLGWNGPGWDQTVHAVACNLLEIANSDWSALIPAEAERLIREHAPTDDHFGAEQIDIKIRSARTRTDGKGRRTPHEVKGRTQLNKQRPIAEGRTLDLVNLAEVEFEVTEWAWQEVVPLGILTGVAGWAGIGKSTLIAWLVAGWTRGAFDGDLKGEPASVLIVAGEDDVSRQLAPRLEVAGADLSRVSVIKPSTTHDGQKIDTVMRLGDDLAEIRRQLIETGSRMLILDPILSFVDGNPNSQGDVRRALDPLAAIARELNVVVIAVMHFKKGNGIAGEKVSGSHVWRDALRSLLVMAVDEDSGYRVVTVDKSNYSTSRGHSMLFDVTGAEVEGRDTKGRRRVQHVSRAEYIGDSPKSVDDLLQEESAKRDGRRVVDDTTAEVIEWIRSQPGPVSWKSICEQFEIDPNGKDADSKRAKTNLTRKLGRAVERGDIEKADRGLYRKPTGLRPLSGLEEF
jgi:hypothetical protein